MKAIKATEGSISTLDKVFSKGVAIEVTKEELKYLQDTFGDVFTFEFDVEPKVKEDSKPKAK